MKAATVFTADTFRFFRDLGKNNHKPWMDSNRDRYKSAVVEPLRALLDRLAPAVQKLDSGFAVSGRTGENFSRINRDIRFAADKSPYRAQMYLFFRKPSEEGGQLYVGVSGDTVTSGFRIYDEGKESALVQIARERAAENLQWIRKQRGRLGKKYNSYWYSTEKGEWTKHGGWPAKPEDWKKLQGWVVRRKFPVAAATRSGFEREVTKIFSEVYPLSVFTASRNWKS
jgi:uncharacterized protein (TIGR02453 family)